MIVNLTPHDVYMIDDGRSRFRFHRSNKPARLQESYFGNTTIYEDGVAIPMAVVTYGDIYNLPEEKPGVFYIVSLLVAIHAKDRKDLLFPVDLVRNNYGEIIGCRKLGRLSQ